LFGLYDKAKNFNSLISNDPFRFGYISYLPMGFSDFGSCQTFNSWRWNDLSLPNPDFYITSVEAQFVSFNVTSLSYSSNVTVIFSDTIFL
jgi:hypothetical protein